MIDHLTLNRLAVGAAPLFTAVLVAAQTPGNAGQASDAELGQLNAPVELIPLRHETNREVCVLGQHSHGGRLVLTPDTCFFHGRLRLTGETTPQYPGAELNGGKSWTRIEGLDEPGKRVVWPLWLPQPAKLKVSVQMEVPVDASGAILEISIGDSSQTVTTQTSDGATPQAWKIELPVTKPGLYELGVALRKSGPAGTVGAIRRLVVTGLGVETAVLVRSRWRPAAIHARFGSSYLARTGRESRLWVMETRPLPCEDSMYAPITTPFGYFGSTFNPDGTSGGINFSMWSFGAGKQAPPIERLSHLLALGDPRQNFGGFSHEGTGVKPRGWNPFEGQKVPSVILAVRLDPGGPYDTYTGYFYDRPSREWKLYASGRKWHDARRGRSSLLPGCFVEVPGPPNIERSAQIMRGTDRRGWFRDAQGSWHPLDQMTVGDIRAGVPVQKAYGLSPDGWFRLTMGGLEQYKYMVSKPVIQSQVTQPLPDYMEPSRLAVLDQMPASLVVEKVKKTNSVVTIDCTINAPQPGGKVTLFYGPEDCLTFEERWPHHLDLGEQSPGHHSFQLPVTGHGACRLLLRGSFGSVWSYSPGSWQ